MASHWTSRIREQDRAFIRISTAWIVAALLVSDARAARVTLDKNGVLEIDGKKTFVISFSIPPPPDGKTPDGNDGWAEIRQSGGNFFRIAPQKGEEQGSPAAM